MLVRHLLTVLENKFKLRGAPNLLQNSPLPQRITIRLSINRTMEDPTTTHRSIVSEFNCELFKMSLAFRWWQFEFYDSRAEKMEFGETPALDIPF